MIDLYKKIFVITVQKTTFPAELPLLGNGQRIIRCADNAGIALVENI